MHDHACQRLSFWATTGDFSCSDFVRLMQVITLMNCLQEC